MPDTTTLCDRCGGTGQYNGTRRDGSSYTGRCFACQGSGPYNGRAFRRVLPAAAAAPGAAPTDGLPNGMRGAANWARFVQAQPHAARWLADNKAAGVNFAASLVNGIARYGNLTPRQLAAVQRNLSLVEVPAATLPAPVFVESLPRASGTLPPPLPATDMAERVLARAAPDLYPAAPVAAPPPVTVDMSRIFSAFDAAAASGLRKVRLTLGDVKFKRFRHGEGLIMAYYKAPQTSQYVYTGFFRRDGSFQKGAGVWHPVSAEIEAFRNAAADPRSAAATHGHDTGHCACCRRLLTDPPSVMAGIGPVCANRYFPLGSF